MRPMECIKAYRPSIQLVSVTVNLREREDRTVVEEVNYFSVGGK